MTICWVRKVLCTTRGGATFDGSSGGVVKDADTRTLKTSNTDHNNNTNEGPFQSMYSKLVKLSRPSTTSTSSSSSPSPPTAAAAAASVPLQTTERRQRTKRSYDDDDVPPSTMAPIRPNESTTTSISAPPYNPLRMYRACIFIVALWIGTGTLFYSICNDWPLPQSFFYAVDAGMSIGFCTDVVETKLVSKAFTIVYILLGASVVGGALALFMQDAVEGSIAINTALTKQYQLLLEKEVFDKFNTSRSGALTFDEFRQLLLSTTGDGGGFTTRKTGDNNNNNNSRRLSTSTTSPPSQLLTPDDIDKLWTKFDRLKDGVIHFEEFAGTYRGIDDLIESLQEQKTATTQPRVRLGTIVPYTWILKVWNSDNRIYFIFLGWVVLGIVWGMFSQGWDPITATHFSISALATGGLTGPPVNEDGILPARPAIFCGLYCLLGIPLMAITLGHFARVLVADHVAAVEKWALTRRITAKEYQVIKEYLKKKPSTYYDDVGIKKKDRRGTAAIKDTDTSRGLHLSDFIVLQLLRQGRLSVEAMDVLRRKFDLLDKDRTGILTLEEATNWTVRDGRDNGAADAP